MAEFSSSPESRALARLKELHHAEQVPPDVRVRVAERLARLEAPAPKRALLRRGGIGLLLLAAAAAVALEVRSDRARVMPLPEQPAASRATELVSLSGAAVPGSLRWRGGGAADGSDQLECQYVFSLEPEGGAPIRVRWTRCEFPGELRVHMRRRRSPASGPLRVFVAGHWSAPGQLEATEIRVLSRATEP
jgi:hypothetical protein